MKRILFLAATAAALLFSGCETPGDDNDNNQNNSENVDNGDNNNDNDNENENNNQDQNDNNGDNDYDEPLIHAPTPGSLLGTVWRTTVEYFDDNGNLTDTEVATIFFDVDEPSQVFIMSQISDPDGNVIETNTVTGTYTYEIPNITISYSVDYGDEEGIVNYILTGTVDGYVMTLSRKDSNGEVYTMTFTRE